MAISNSYYLYEKYERRGAQPWIPVYPNTWSINGDGTMPLVLKQQGDPECAEVMYRWLQTEDMVCVEVLTRQTSGTPYCINYDKYVDVTTEESIDSGETWNFASSSSTLVEHNSQDCGYVPQFDGRYIAYFANQRYEEYCSGTSGTTIGAYTFNDTTWGPGNFSSIQIGTCVTAINDLAFSKWIRNTMEELNTLIIPDGIRFTGYTFAGFDDLVKIKLPYDSDYLGSFSGCTSLTGITIPSAVTSISDNTFDGCSSLGSIIIPNSVTSIGSWAFTYCTGLTSVTIGNGVTSIGDYAFNDCSRLTSVTIPNNITSIGDYAFKSCRSFTGITVNATTPPTLGNGAFDNTNNCPIYVPCESVEIYKAVNGWSTYASRIQGIPPCGQPTPGSAKFRLTLSDSSTVSAECDSTSAITSGEVSSQYSGTVVSAEIGNCVTSIGEETFYKCRSLSSITIPNSVTMIGNNAFYNCRSLSSITIPNSVTSIGTEAFRDCRNLSSIDIPNSVTSIGDRAFQYCTGLTNCTIGSGVTSIGETAFFSCGNLTYITVDSNNTVYDSRNNCNAIIETSTDTLVQGCKNTVIPNTVTSIGSYAFQQCYYLQNITIPSSVTSIGQNAFQYCASLSDITIPDSVTSIGSQAFSDCARATGITIGNGITTIGYASFLNCKSATTLTIGNNVTSIGDYAFSDCEALTSITIPNSVRTIGEDAFSTALNATSLIIGSGVTSIGKGAFSMTGRLQSITVNATTPPTLGNGAFDNTNNCPIYVPSGSVNAYKSATNWSTYASRIQAIP